MNFPHKSVKIAKSHFSWAIKCYEHDYGKIISPVDNFYGINCFYNQCIVWLDSEDIGKTRISKSPFQINEINENNGNSIQL